MTSILGVTARKQALKLLAIDEGFRGHFYKDSKGHLTIGYGFNLETTDIPQFVADEWLSFLIDKISLDLQMAIPVFESLNDPRRYVLINMAYHMGISGLLKFDNMLKYLQAKDFVKASSEMKDSQWYRDFPNRANRLINIMIKGEF